MSLVYSKNDIFIQEKDGRHVMGTATEKSTNHSAEWYAQRIQGRIDSASFDLKPDEEIALYAHTINGKTLVDRFGVHNPNMFVVYERNADGTETTHLLPSLTVSIEIVKKVASASARTMGFYIPESAE